MTNRRADGNPDRRVYPRFHPPYPRVVPRKCGRGTTADICKPGRVKPPDGQRSVRGPETKLNDYIDLPITASDRRKTVFPIVRLGRLFRNNKTARRQRSTNIPVRRDR